VQDKVEDEWAFTINRSLIVHLIGALNFACSIFVYPFVCLVKISTNKVSNHLSVNNYIFIIYYILFKTVTKLLTTTFFNLPVCMGYFPLISALLVGVQIG